MSNILPKSFYELEKRVEDLYKLIPSLIIQDGDDDELHCGSCRNILIRAYKCNCKHHFCGPCIIKLVNQKCPLDSTVIDPKKVSHREDEKKIEQKVVSLLVQCSNEGCNVNVPIINILEHYKTCKSKQQKQENSKKNATKPTNKSHEFVQLQLDFQNYKDETQSIADSLFTSIGNIEIKFQQLTTQITQLQQKLDQMALTMDQHQLKLSLIDASKENDKVVTKNSQDNNAVITCQIATYKKTRKAKTQLKNETFELNNGYHFRLSVFSESDHLGFDLTLLPSDGKVSHPLTGKVKVAMLSSSNEQWICKSIPVNFPKSTPKLLTELKVPKFIPLQSLNKFLGQNKAFQFQITFCIND